MYNLIKLAGALNILLVEDDADDARIFTSAVKKLLVHVKHVANATDAIAQLTSQYPPPDLIVLDMTLPGMSSAEFLDWVENQPSGKKIPICIYTGSSIISRNLKSRVGGAFFKTGSPEEIRRKLSEMCALCT